MITREQILNAESLIRPHIRRTPIIHAPAGELAECDVILKLELLQHTGSFKPRGAFHRMLANPVPAAGVIAASGGNHGLAVAYAAKKLGYRAEIFVPTLSPQFKVDKLRGYGATVHVIGSQYMEALAACEQRQAETGALAVHAYNQWEVLAGQGTVGKELQEQAPEATTVLVAVGGGGFIGGIAAWMRGDIRVISVEPATCPSLAVALDRGAPTRVEVTGLAADSLGASQVGEMMFPIAQKYVSGAVLVEDVEIRDAQRALWDRFRLIAEPGGAAAFAALYSGKYQPASGERVAVFVCGANTNPASFLTD